MWSGVKMACGMFIVLPILIILVVVVFLALVGSVGGLFLRPAPESL